MVSESYLKGKIQKYLRGQGWYVKYYSGHGYGAAGIPDILGCRNGHFLAIEIKTEKGKLSKLQAHTIERIKEEGGGIAVVVYGWNDFLKQFELIKKITEEKRHGKSRQSSDAGGLEAPGKE